MEQKSPKTNASGSLLGQKRQNSVGAVGQWRRQSICWGQQNKAKQEPESINSSSGWPQQKSAGGQWQRSVFGASMSSSSSKSTIIMSTGSILVTSQLLLRSLTKYKNKAGLEPEMHKLGNKWKAQKEGAHSMISDSEILRRCYLWWFLRGLFVFILQNVCRSHSGRLWLKVEGTSSLCSDDFAELWSGEELDGEQNSRWDKTHH